MSSSTAKEKVNFNCWFLPLRWQIPVKLNLRIPFFIFNWSLTKGKVEIYLEKTVNFSFVKIFLLMNNILSHWISMEYLQKSGTAFQLFSLKLASLQWLQEEIWIYEFSLEGTAGGQYFVSGVSGGKWSVMIQGVYSRPLLTLPPSVKFLLDPVTTVVFHKHCEQL